MMRYLLPLLLGFTLMLGVRGTVHASTPDEVRERQLQMNQEAVTRIQKQDQPAKPAPKPHIWLMGIRAPGHPVSFLQVYQDKGACDGNARLLARQLAKLGWGTAACIEQVAP